MKWIACLAFALGGCHRGDGGSSEKPPADYAQDIASLCDVLHLAKADELPENQRPPVIAMWLGPHIKTAAGRDFLVKIQPLQGAAKADALDAEAHRVGLTNCALSAEWRR